MYHIATVTFFLGSEPLCGGNEVTGSVVHHYVREATTTHKLIGNLCHDLRIPHI